MLLDEKMSSCLRVVSHNINLKKVAEPFQDETPNDVTGSLISLFASTSPSNDDVRAAILSALIALNEVGVVTNASLLSAEFLEHLSDSLSKNLVRLF